MRAPPENRKPSLRSRLPSTEKGSAVLLHGADKSWSLEFSTYEGEPTRTRDFLHVLRHKSRDLLLGLSGY